MRILISACLAGKACSYDGQARTVKWVKELAEKGEAVLVCPECLGGLPVPRPPAEIQGGSGEDVLQGRARVCNKWGEDVTGYFLRGARLVQELVRREGIKRAILKARSPSCGRDVIYDGSFSGRLKPGHGVTAALLLADGIKIITEEEEEKLKDMLKETP